MSDGRDSRKESKGTSNLTYIQGEITEEILFRAANTSSRLVCPRKPLTSITYAFTNNILQICYKVLCCGIQLRTNRRNSYRARVLDARKYIYV